MSVYVPEVQIERLRDRIAGSLDIAYHYATLIAVAVADVAVSAAITARSDANAYTDITEQIIYNNLDADLARVMDYTDRQVDIVVDGLSKSIDLLQSQISELSGGISDDSGEELEKAYDGISQSHTVVGTLIDQSLASVGAQVSGTHEKVGELINNGLIAATSWIGDTIIEITSAIRLYTQQALDVLIPAEALALYKTIGDILDGDPIRSLMVYSGNIFGGVLENVLTIDDAELEKWIARGSGYVHNIAMQSAKP